MKKILLSGFGPFLDVKNNPSEEIVKELAARFNLPHIILPVVFNNAFEVLKEKILMESPDVILMFGVATGRTKISLERIGLNWVESKNPDTLQVKPASGKIDPQQELALMTTINVENILSKLSLDERSIVEISYSAGTYVCNDLYFRSLNDKSLKCEKLFVHIPSFDQLDAVTQMNLLSKVVESAKT